MFIYSRSLQLTTIGKNLLAR